MYYACIAVRFVLVCRVASRRLYKLGSIARATGRKFSFASDGPVCNAFHGLGHHCRWLASSRLAATGDCVCCEPTAEPLAVGSIFVADSVNRVCANRGNLVAGAALSGCTVALCWVHSTRMDYHSRSVLPWCGCGEVDRDIIGDCFSGPVAIDSGSSPRERNLNQPVLKKRHIQVTIT